MNSDDMSYLKRFEQRDLSPKHFDHRGHLFLAWVHLVHFQFDEANHRVCDGIKALANKFNAPEKYNHTLTEALMRIIAIRIQEQSHKGFEQFLDNNSDLVQSAEDILAQHYSLACLNSATAKQQWVEPDLNLIN